MQYWCCHGEVIQYWKNGSFFYVGLKTKKAGETRPRYTAKFLWKQRCTQQSTKNRLPREGTQECVQVCLAETRLSCLEVEWVRLFSCHCRGLDNLDKERETDQFAYGLGSPYVPTHLCLHNPLLYKLFPPHLHNREIACYGLNMRCPLRPVSPGVEEARRPQDGKTARKSQQPPTGWRSKPEGNIAPQQQVSLPAPQRDHPEDRETPWLLFSSRLPASWWCFWLADPQLAMSIDGVYRGSPTKRRQGEGYSGLLYPLVSH